MPKKRSWTDDQLREAVKTAKSFRAVITKLGLVPAGGNYAHVKRRVEEMNLDTEHFLGKGWNIGLRMMPKKAPPLETLLVLNSKTQSYKLKKRLLAEGLKTPECELCGWAEHTIDGRLPLELDHINGDRYDNRLKNLQVLCPNCHSLQPTHRCLNRGKNK